MRVPGAEAILFLKENGCSSSSFTGNSRRRKDGRTGAVSMNLSNNVLPYTSFTSLAYGAGGFLRGFHVVLYNEFTSNAN